MKCVYIYSNMYIHIYEFIAQVLAVPSSGGRFCEMEGITLETIHFLSILRHSKSPYLFPLLQRFTDFTTPERVLVIKHTHIPPAFPFPPTQTGLAAQRHRALQRSVRRFGHMLTLSCLCLCLNPPSDYFCALSRTGIWFAGYICAMVLPSGRTEDKTRKEVRGRKDYLQRIKKT